MWSGRVTSRTGSVTVTNVNHFGRTRDCARVLTLAGCMAIVMSAAPSGQSLPVLHPEGLVHGFLTLKTLEGKMLADGDLIQNVRGDRVTSRLWFRFRDGSTHDETVVYAQQPRFRLITDRLVQKGPSFPRTLDMSLDGASGRAVVKYTDDGEQKVDEDRLELPQDLVNGFVSTFLKNVRPNAVPESVSYVAATPKPRLVNLEISVAGTDTFKTGATARKATHYVLKVKIGGLTGWLAPIVGKQPPDVHVWILGGQAPAFIRADQPLYAGGPVWRIELASPTWSPASLPSRFK